MAKEHRIIVTPEWRNEPDWTRFVQALLALVRERADDEEDDKSPPGTVS